MKHEKTFAAINKLKDVELELHRLKNALEMANRALEAQRPWVGLTDEEIWGAVDRIGTSDSDVNPYQTIKDARNIEDALKEKNT
jgi:hypothetical protein